MADPYSPASADITVLAAAVVLRIPPKTLKQATNTDTSASYDTGMLDLACGDVITDMAVEGQVVWSSTDERHVRIAVRGVFLMLLAYKSEQGDVDRYDAWLEKRIRNGLRLTEAGARVVPKTDGSYNPITRTDTEPPFSRARNSDIRAKTRIAGRQSIDDLGSNRATS